MSPDQAYATITGLVFVLVGLVAVLLWTISQKGSQ